MKGVLAMNVLKTYCSSYPNSKEGSCLNLLEQLFRDSLTGMFSCASYDTKFQLVFKMSDVSAISSKFPVIKDIVRKSILKRRPYSRVAFQHYYMNGSYVVNVVTIDRIEVLAKGDNISEDIRKQE